MSAELIGVRAIGLTSVALLIVCLAAAYEVDVRVAEWWREFRRQPSVCTCAKGRVCPKCLGLVK